MKIKITKNKIIVAAVIICVLAAAWFYGGNYPEKAAVPEQSPVAGTKMTKSEKDAFPAGSGMFPEDANPSGSGTPSGDAEERTAEPAEIAAVEMQEQPAGKEARPESGAEALAKGKSESEVIESKAAKKAANPTDANPKTGKDQYLTDPVPEGKPAPAEWQEVTVNTEVKLTCRLSVTCATILDNMSRFNQDKLEVLPAEGVIYPPQNVVFYEGESVFNVLQREMKKHKIHMEFTMTPLYNSHYIEGINNIYEFDCGELSGWMYKVNDWCPNYGCSRYLLQDGDVIEWLYTCDLGRDLGEEWLGGNNR